MDNIVDPGCISPISIRAILPADNPVIAAIIRGTLTEFGQNRPGTAYYDAAIDDMYSSFQTPGSRYHVSLFNGQIIGGGGVYPSNGLPTGIAELVKMYLHPSARGMGAGKRLIEACVEFARQYGYKQLYLETMPEFGTAVAIYEKFGFRYLSGPLGNTGHYGCTVWMLKDL
ncbi:GNAT family N-acetyltransferase [Puia dinghuensis]|uniref:N-acetyltransferase n=1 Tax=Puia dinghuensis TaxID=1792502 RepID=A0A8J2XSJ4_9BACT|nr:GNAT family N-acetyltransferase [Puia dinghuensis]GGA91391.1 N-acetyltransferase [Puia dinghuensis]